MVRNRRWSARALSSTPKRTSRNAEAGLPAFVVPTAVLAGSSGVAYYVYSLSTQQPALQASQRLPSCGPRSLVSSRSLVSPSGFHHMQHGCDLYSQRLQPWRNFCLKA
jgi:hypothetical protein